MKICLLGYKLLGKRKEGVKHVVYGIAKSLAKIGISVFIVTNGDMDTVESVDGFKVISIKSPQSTAGFIIHHKKFVERLKSVLMSERPDIIHDHFVLPGTSALITLPLKNLVPSIYIKHIYNLSLSLDDVKSLLFPFNIQYFISEAIIRVIANNEWTDRIVYKQFDASTCFTNDILDQVRGWNVGIEIFKEKIGIPHDFFVSKKKAKEFVFGYLGHPSFKKGLDIFIEACWKFLPKYPWLKVVVSTSLTAEGVSTYTKKLMKLKLSFPNNVVVMGEVSPISLFQQTEIMVFPLRHHWAAISPPLSVLEAMASASLVLTRPVNGLQDFIKQGKSGFYMKRCASNDMLKSIDKLIKLSSLQKQRVRNQARKMVLGNEWHKIGLEYMQIYRKVLHDSK